MYGAKSRKVTASAAHERQTIKRLKIKNMLAMCLPITADSHYFVNDVFNNEMLKISIAFL